MYIIKKLEQPLLDNTQDLTFEYMDFRTVKNLPLTPIFDNFDHKFNLGTVSNADLKSIKQLNNLFFSWSVFIIRDCNEKIASTVLRPGLKPN